MAGEQINIGSIVADLDVNSGKMAEGLAAGQSALNKIMAELKSLDAQLKGGAIGFDAYVKRTADLSTAAGEISGKMRAANEALMAGTSAVDLLNQKLAAAGGAGKAAAEGIRNLEAEIAAATGKVYAMADSYAVLDAAQAKAFREGVANAPETVSATRKSKVEALRAEFAEMDALAAESYQKQQALAEAAYQKELAAAIAVSNGIQAGFERQYQAAEAAYQKERAAAEETAKAMIAAFSAMEQHKASEAAETAAKKQTAAALGAAQEVKNLDYIIKVGTNDMYGYAMATSVASTKTVDLASHAIPPAVSAMYKEAAALKAAEDRAVAAATAKTKLAASTQQVGKSTRDASGGVSNLSIGMMQLGYIADDLQYGFQAVVNNVAPAVYSFGRALGMAAGPAAGFSAALQLTSVLAYQLYKHWDDLLEVMGKGDFKTEAEEMKKLGEATKLTADQAERLAKFKAVEGKTQELVAAKTEGEKKGEDVATKAIVEAGVDDVMKGILKTVPEILDNDSEVIAAKNELARLERIRDKKEVPGFLEQVKNTALNVANVHTGVGVAPEERERQALVNANQAIKDAREMAAKRHAAAGTLPNMNPEGLKQLSEQVAKNPKEFGPHVLPLQEGLKEAQRQAEMTPEKRQQDTVKKGIQKTWDQFKKHFDTEVEKVIGKDEKLGEKALAHRIKKAFPDLKAAADRMAMQEDEGEIERANSLKHLQDTLIKGGISRQDAEKAALKAMEKTDEEDPETRRKRVEREAVQKADELNAKKDLKGRASRLAQDVHFGKKTGEDARMELASELIESGMGRDDAIDAAGVFMREANKEDPKARQKRLKKESLQKADEAVPDLSDAVESAIARGVDTGKLRKGLEARFKKADMGDVEAAEAASQAIERGQESVRQRLGNFAAQHGQDKNYSEVMATSGLTQKVQAGVEGKTEAKKTNDLLEKQRVLLEKIANKSAVQLELK